MTAPEKGSYYSRNRERLRAYQHKYNEVKRLGPRKMGKEERRELEEKRRRALAGEPFLTYANEIVRRDSRQDPEESTEMQLREREYAWFETTLTRMELQRDYPEAWIQLYLSFLRDRLANELSIARRELSEAPDLETIHFRRRVIAFYHQELELNSQGEGVWLAAENDKTLVIYGRGINKIKFKQLYGF